jgi:hypothetical protein
VGCGFRLDRRIRDYVESTRKEIAALTKARDQRTETIIQELQRMENGSIRFRNNHDYAGGWRMGREDCVRTIRAMLGAKS